MRLVAISDHYIPHDFMQRGLAPLAALGVDVEIRRWEHETLVELQQANLAIEQGGPEAVELPEAFFERLGGVEILVTQFAPVARRMIEAAAGLKVIGVLRGGVENVAVDLATERGISVLNTPGRNARAVAECTMGLILAEIRNLARSHACLKSGRWRREFANSAAIPELNEKTVGLVGYGAVGRLVARYLEAFGSRILAYDPFFQGDPAPARLVDLPALLRQADVVSLHARLSEETRHLIGAAELAMMKPSAVLVNTARSGLVDERALVAALAERRIMGAALDVFDVEPLPPDSPLLTLENVTITPHLAGSTIDAFRGSPPLMAGHLARMLRGERGLPIINGVPPAIFGPAQKSIETEPQGIGNVQMKSILIAPRKYVQGRGVLNELGDYLKPLGAKALVLWDAHVKGIVGQAVAASLDAAGIEMVDVNFEGEATSQERKRVGEIARREAVEISIGVGGGKALDVAKAVAIDLGLKMVTCPTIASNDSPTSAASVWYDAEHNFVGFDCWPFNPDLVLVDTQVVVGGPVRAFVAGIGDALSTWLEAEAAQKSRALNIAGGQPTMAAMALARLAFDTLLQHGPDAKRDVELGLVTPAVEKVVEANVLLSGLGFESGGLATAHMIGNLLSNEPECREAGMMHGEKVAFGVVAQLCLDDDFDVDDKSAIVDFLIEIGLPVSFADLNLEGIARERLEALAAACAGEGSLCHNHPFKVTAADVLDAMISADALGQHRKAMLEEV